MNDFCNTKKILWKASTQSIKYPTTIMNDLLAYKLDDDSQV